jgi:hypothetical protein
MRVRVRALHTTIGRLLAELSKQTGVRLQPLDTDVAEEGVAAFFGDRSLASVMELVAANYRWGERLEHGLVWRRTTRGGEVTYELGKDLATRRLPTEMRRQDRLDFVKRAEEDLKVHTGASPLGLRDTDILAAIPGDVLRRALMGERVSISLRACSEALRGLARRVLAGSGLDDRGWIEIGTVGEGESLSLDFRVQPYGHGGAGILYQPKAYIRRFRPSSEAAHLQDLPARAPDSGALAQRLEISVSRAPRGRAVPLTEALAFIVDSSGVDLVADDYGYSVDCDRALTPGAAPIGDYLRALGASVNVAGSIKPGRLRITEADNCILVRNANWYGDDALRPGAELRARIRALQRRGTPYVLSLAEVAGILADADDGKLQQLQATNLVPGGAAIASRRSIFTFWRLLDAGRREKLWSPAGLRLSDLTPTQRTMATRHAPGIRPLISETNLERLGGDLTLRLHINDGRLYIRRSTPVHETPEAAVDLRLPHPGQTPEVCQVAKLGMP